MAALNYLLAMSQSFVKRSVSSTSSGPMQTIFEKNGIDVLVEEPNNRSAISYDKFVVNSLIRSDAADFLMSSNYKYFQFIHEDWGPDDFLGEINPDWGWFLDSWKIQKERLSTAEKLIFPASYIAREYDAFDSAVIFNPVNPNALLNIRKHDFNCGYGIDVINIASINQRKNQTLLVNLCKKFKEISSCRLFGRRSIRESEIRYFDELSELSHEVDSCEFEFNESRFPLSIDVFMNSVFVLPSIAEVLPCTIQEMMMTNVPVVAPNNFGIPEVIVNGYSGVLFDSYDLVSVFDSILNAHQNRAVICNNAYNFAKGEFSMESQSNKLVEILLK